MTVSPHTSASRFSMKSTDGRAPRRNGRRRGLFLAVVVVLVLGSGAAAWAVWHNKALSGPGAASNLVLHEVQLGDLSVEVTDRGNLESAKNVEHRCEVEGRSGGGAAGAGGGGGTTILWVIEEGTQVKEGDLLVELDSSNLEDNQKTQKIAYENARSTYEKAKADVDTAEQVIKEHVEGLFIQDEQTRQADLTVAEENLTRAKDSLRHTQNLYEKGFATKEELAAAEFAVTSSELNLKNAQTALDVFLKVTKSRTLTELNGDLAAKQAVLAAEQTKVAQEKDRLDKIEAQLKKCKIYAKGDGMVVYYVSPQRWGSEGKQIEEGAVVIERQKIIILPDLSQMQVRMLVHESKIDWVREGQPARIRVDAFANQVLRGHVKSVATTPEQGPWYDRDKRNYPVIVTIDEPIEGLKPGMTAETTILVEKLSQVVTLPVQCVRTVGKTRYCYVSKEGKVQEREIEVGRSNDQFVEIKSGVEVGEKVVESPVESLGESFPFTQESLAESAAGPQFSEDEAAAAESAAEQGEGDAKQKRGERADPFQFDKNKDGKLSKDEVPEQMLQFFDVIDADKDGLITRSEMSAAQQKFRQRQRQGGGPGGGPGGS